MIFLSAIAIKVVKHEPLVGKLKAFISVEKGLKGDVRGRGGRRRTRQVTVISANQWREVCSDMGWNPEKYSWMLRRAGLCVEGIWFHRSHIGQRMYIGDDVVLEITDETKPCERMDEIGIGLTSVLSIQMRGGVTCKVIKGGPVHTQMPVIIA